MDSLTHRLSECIQGASNLVLHEDHAEVTNVHVLLLMVRDGGSFLNGIARECGIENGELLPRLSEMMAKLPKLSREYNGEISFSQDFRRVYNLAKKETANLKDSHMSSDVFVHMCVRHDPAVNSLFASLGVKPQQVKEAVAKLRAGESTVGKNGEEANAALERYTVDLTARARDGELDPVVGRDGEIRRAMQILQRRTKNNPVLIGEPGVGKTAIVEGLAQRMVAGEVPSGLRHRRVLSVDLAAMVAGATHRGEFEERFKSVLKEIARNQDKYVIFIDELHTLVGAGNATGGFDAANMLKPALAKGQLRCIGATTLDEYRLHIERDAALERRFQRLPVREPDQAAAVSILRGLADRYILHHGVRISDPALVAAVELSARYVPDRFLPDKAIDLMDEAAAKLRIERDSKPEEIYRLERSLSQLKMDEQAVRHEKDQSSRKRLSEIKEKIKEAEKEIASLTEIWREEKSLHEAIQRNKQEREDILQRIEGCKKKGDFEEAAKLQYVDLEQRDKKSEAFSRSSERQLLPLEVGEKEIAEVVARATGVPVSRLLGAERERLLGMEDSLKSRVVNQDAAISPIVGAVLRSRTGLSSPDRPNGTFMFLGATGVGKTELAKALAEFLFGSERHMVRIDMSEYMEKHSIARLIGAPPGYIGYEEGGQLTEAVRRRPYSVVLFDEIEKAHREVLNLLLQVLDDGRLTTSQGRTVDFRNTVLVMTSNVGASHLAGGAQEGERELALAEVRASFSPEFLNRLDEIVVFNGLGPEAIKRIATMQLRGLATRIEVEGLSLAWDDRALEFLSQQGFDPAFGARPLKRTIQRMVETPVAKAILEGKCRAGTSINLAGKEGKLRIRYSGRAAPTP